jgi:DNA-binding transcriptional LysR family regulator
MSKAAALLSTGQSAISRSIAELERTLGVRLLDRTPQGVEPTTYGRTLLSGGAAVFDDLRQTVKSIEFLADPTVGEVRIGSITPLAVSFIAQVVDRLSRRYPRIVFRVVVTPTEAFPRELSERNVDLVIARRYSSFADERMNFEFLFDDAFVVVAGAQSPWSRRRKIELAELMDEPWALPPAEGPLGSLGPAFVEAFRARGLDYPRATLLTLPVEMRLSLVATGRFLSIFSTSLMRFATTRMDLKVLPVELSLARVPVGILTLKNRTLSPVVQLFIDHVREVAKSLPKRKL